jgi:DNA-binding transcriptional ArsR family regulator
MAVDRLRAPPILNLMVKFSPKLDATFLALADPTRRAILNALSRGPASVSDLARPHEMSLPGVMKHLRVLEEAGLLSQHKTGRVRQCRLTAQPLRQASDWLAQYEIFWESQLDSLERYLNETQTPEVTACSKRKLPSRRARS